MTLTWATMDRIPSTAMNSAILTDSNPMICEIEGEGRTLLLTQIL